MDLRIVLANICLFALVSGVFYAYYLVAKTAVRVVKKLIK